MYQATALENAPPSNHYPRDQGNGYRPSYPGRESWSANPGGMPAIPPTMFTPGECGFCSVTGHFLRECPGVAEYIWLGCCFRNQENRIVLPTGRYIPRAVVGRNLRERIDTWIADNRPVQTQSFERDQPPHKINVMTFTTTEPVQTFAFSRIPVSDWPDAEDEAQVLANERAKRGKGKEDDIPEVVI
ncbi:hypothetical protein DFH09DRAFT_1111819 [Mycena vulgaris]|nr:hypothetical protein DFH09DRAFT_1111819 [Mycena vulgaris]